jgi:hypothetical protein
MYTREKPVARLRGKMLACISIEPETQSALKRKNIFMIE